MSESTQEISSGEHFEGSGTYLSPSKGMMIGHYRMMQPLGGGGQGEVWLAEQLEPIRRRAAVKLLRQRNLKPAMIARFEAETQALAMMDHPHIAKIYEAGVAEEFGPYFAMEFCHGKPITRYCDEKRLSIPQRLELFQQICQAVQHAHQKGIIHRDIKPSNVLVAEADGVPSVKVIDFGLAKAMESQLKLTEKSIVTEIGQLIGTYKYMSPEQAAANPIDIDTRSDIYSLGVLLYELLTGTTPVDDASMGGKALVEVIRLIREHDPKLPSRRLSDSHDSLSVVSSSRQSDPKKLPSVIQGDLDWIVMKSLEKDRSRRYATPNHLAEDIQRHLRGEPVNAAPPSNVYRLRKLLWRNRLPATISALFLFILLAGIVGTSIGFYKSSRAATLAQERLVEANKAKLAEQQQREAADAQRKVAEEQTKIASDKLELSESVIDFLLVDLLAQASPKQQSRDGFKGNPDLTVRDAVQRAAEKIDERFEDRPIIQARIREVIAESQRQLGDYESAIMQFERALALFAANLDSSDKQYLECLQRTAITYGDQGQLEKCQELLEKILKYSKAEPNDPMMLTTSNNLAIVYQMRGEYKKASDLQEQAVARHTAELGREDVETLVAMNNLAVMYGTQFNYRRSIEILEEVAALQAKKPGGEESSDVLSTRRNLSTGYREVGRVDDALALLLKTIDSQRTVLGKEDVDVATSLNRLGGIYSVKKDFANARKAFEESLAIQQKALPPTHPEVLQNRASLALLENDEGNPKRALEVLQGVYEDQLATLGKNHPHSLASLRNLGNLHLKAGDPDKAISTLQEAIELMKGPKYDNWHLGHAHSKLGEAFLAKGDLQRAETHLVTAFESLELRRPTVPYSHRSTFSDICKQLVEVYRRLEKTDEATRWEATLKREEEAIKE